MLSTLPVTYETEPAPYDELVEEFGTHYFVNARFGGSIFFKSFIDNTYLYSSSESSLRAQLEAKFVFLTGKLTGLANSTMVNEKFQTAAQVDFQVYGGQYIPGQSSNVSHRGRWQKSAIKSPWLVGGKLQSIERLIANESVRQEVKKAIAWKLLRAYAEDLKATLKLSHVRLPEHQQQQWKDIQENLKKAKSTSKGDVNQMKDQLSEMFLTHQEMMGKGIRAGLDLTRLLIDFYLTDLRLLAGFATQLLDLLTDSFLEARLHRMVHSCASEAQEKRLKTEGELFRSLQEELLRLNSSSTRPDTDLINQFGRKILPFAIKHEQIDGFCAENKQCQKCAQVKLGYTKNWSFYVQFYLNKLYEFKKEALNCKADCKVDFEKISARFDEVYGKLDDAFQKENRPLKSKLQEWVKEVYSILALARNESFLFLYLL